MHSEIDGNFVWLEILGDFEWVRLDVDSLGQILAWVRDTCEDNFIDENLLESCVVNFSITLDSKYEGVLIGESSGGMQVGNAVGSIKAASDDVVITGVVVNGQDRSISFHVSIESDLKSEVIV